MPFLYTVEAGQQKHANRPTTPPYLVHCNSDKLGLVCFGGHPSRAAPRTIRGVHAAVVWPEAHERTCPFFHVLPWNLAFDCVSSKEAALDWFQSRGLPAFQQAPGAAERGLDRPGNAPNILKWYGAHCAMTDPKEARVVAKAREKFRGYWDKLPGGFRDIPVPWWGVDTAFLRTGQAPLAHHVDPGDTRAGVADTPTLHLSWLVGGSPGVPVPQQHPVVPERPRHPGTPARTDWASWEGTLDYREQGPPHAPLRVEGLLPGEAAAQPLQEEEDREDRVGQHHGPIPGMPAPGTILAAAGGGGERWSASIDDTTHLVPGGTGRGYPV